MADSHNGYGWISIAFHWLAAAIVPTMFIIGSMSQGADDDAGARLVHLHTTIGVTAYALLLFAIAAMLVSGPAMIWLDGASIHVFSLAIPSPTGALPGAQRILRAVHGYAASFILAGVILHVLAVFKHAVLNRDGTFDKIMIAAGGRNDRLDRIIQDKAKA